MREIVHGLMMCRMKGDYGSNITTMLWVADLSSKIVRSTYPTHLFLHINKNMTCLFGPYFLAGSGKIYYLTTLKYKYES